MSKPVKIQFGEWLPDQPKFNSPGSPHVNNVTPGFVSFEPFKGKNLITTDTTNILAGQEVIDAFSITSPAGQAIMAVVRDDATGVSELLSLKGTVWIKIQTLLSEANERQVTFAQWDSETVMFSSGSGFTPSYFNPFSDLTATVMTSGNTYPITKADRIANGAPPEMKYIAAVNRFVVLANAPDEENKVKWSQNGDIDTWEEGFNSAGSETIRGGSGITGILGGRNGLIFMEETIHLMQFTGGASVFQFQRVQDNVGCVAQQTIAQAGDRIFFLDRRGFFETDTLARTIIPIGEGKVNGDFFDNANLSFPERMSTAVDPTRPIIYWSYVSNASTNTSQLPDKLIMYNWQARRWAQGDLECNTIFSAFDLGTVFADVSGQFDTQTLQFDDPFWQGGGARFGVIDRDNKLNYMNGNSLAAVIETGQTDIGDMRRVRIDSITPLVDMNKVQGRVNLVDRLGDTETTTEFTDVDPDGNVKIQEDARYISARINVPASTTWTHAQGIEVNLAPSGKTN